jgi:hypothetical protein
MPFYTGVGSRQTPPPVLDIMREAGRRLALLGWTLRSGHAEGADPAFEEGCDAAGGAKEIFLPWAGFNGSTSSFHGAPAAAFEIAKRIHPAWDALTDYVRKCQARDIQQVLGPALDKPSLAVIAWTEGGALVGGTATALRLAAERGIMALNLGVPENRGLGAEDIVTRLQAIAQER